MSLIIPYGRLEVREVDWFRENNLISQVEENQDFHAIKYFNYAVLLNEKCITW